MNKEEYLKELAKALKNLPEEERQDALAYYQEYFDEVAHLDDPSRQELESPKKVANAILADYFNKQIEKTASPAQKGFLSLKTIVLLIFAAPIGLPLAVALVVVVLALAFSLFAVIFSLGLTSICLLVGAVIGIIFSLIFIPVHFPSALFMFGSSLVIGGLGILLFYAIFVLGKKTLVKLTSRVSTKAKRGEFYES